MSNAGLDGPHKGNFLSLWLGIKSCGKPHHTKGTRDLKIGSWAPEKWRKWVENSGVESPEKGRSAAYLSVYENMSVFKCSNVKHYRGTVCECVMDESECLPWGGLSFTRWWSLPSSLLKAAILAIRPRRPLSENNHPQRVCQLFEKLTTISDCTYYSHPGLLGQLRLRSERDCDIFSLPVEMVSQHQALWSVSHSGGRSALVLGCALLHCGNYLQTAPVFWQSVKSSCHGEIKLQD